MSNIFKELKRKISKLLDYIMQISLLEMKQNQIHQKLINSIQWKKILIDLKENVKLSWVFPIEKLQ